MYIVPREYSTCSYTKLFIEFDGYKLFIEFDGYKLFIEFDGCKLFIEFDGCKLFIEFDGCKLFPLSSIFISSGSTFLGDLKITSLVFYILREFLFALNQLLRCFISRLTSLFGLTYLYEKFVLSAK